MTPEERLRAAYDATSDLPDRGPADPPVARRRRWWVPVGAAAAASVLALGVGVGAWWSDRDDAPTPAAETSAPALWQTYGEAMVLERDGAATLCVGAVLLSDPPAGCGGPRLTSWSWEGIDHDDVDGVRWGTAWVEVTYDEAARTVTPVDVAPTAPAGAPRPTPPTRDFSTPCPAPAEGWFADGPTDDDAVQRLAAVAERRPDLGLFWVDGTPGAYVANISVTSDPAQVERELREIYDGPMCVSRAERSRTELERIVEELRDEIPGLHSSSPGLQRVEISVTADDGTLQREMDARYGEGVVEVLSLLAPA
ncbi:MAG: hypothetical protein Q4G43_13955 [Mobilicoccus sp.]|nr:hypothetical protein [Mobilicoccus sp.]